MAEFTVQQKSLARSMHKEGRLAESRTLWLTLLTLDTSDAEAQAAVTEIDNIIAKRVDEAWGKGESSFKRGAVRDGDIWMLKVLAAQPGHRGALEWLAKNQTSRVQAQQHDKSHKENREVLVRQRAAPGGVNEQIQDFYSRGEYQKVLDVGGQLSGEPNSKVAGLLRKSHIALADRAEGKGNLKLTLTHIQGAITSAPQTEDPLLSRSAALRAQISTQLYRAGLSLMKHDLAAAIDTLEQSVFYNPYNKAAKSKLRQAQTLQKNLKKIQGNAV